MQLQRKQNKLMKIVFESQILSPNYLQGKINGESQVVELDSL